jgi:hypothetical protein
MSSTSAIGSSASASYAVQLAQTSALQRSLYNLDTAVQNGNLTSARSNLSALMKAYPQYAPSSGASSTDQDPINQDFQALANALDQNDVDGAKAAWAKVKSELTNAGLPAIKNPSDTAALALAQNKASQDQAMLSALLGPAPSSDSTIATLLGGSTNPASTSDSVSALVSHWIAYQSDGTTLPGTSPSTGAQLNAAA